MGTAGNYETAGNYGSSGGIMQEPGLAADGTVGAAASGLEWFGRSEEHVGRRFAYNTNPRLRLLRLQRCQNPFLDLCSWFCDLQALPDSNHPASKRYFSDVERQGRRGLGHLKDGLKAGYGGDTESGREARRRCGHELKRRTLTGPGCGSTTSLLSTTNSMSLCN